MATVMKLPSLTDQVISATVRALYSGRTIDGRRMTADDVADAIGVSHGTISNRLREGGWKATEVKALADYFNVALMDLYSGMGGTFPGPVGGALPRHDSNVQPAGCVDRWLELVA